MAKKTKPSEANGASGPKMGGPFLSIASYCDRVLHEKDEVISLIRLVDRMTIQGPAAEMPPGKVRISAALGFKRGDAASQHSLTFTMRDPFAKKVFSVQSEIAFAANDDVREAGAFLEIDATFDVAGPGLYVGEVRLGGKLFAKMPLRIRYEQAKSRKTKS